MIVELSWIAVTTPSATWTCGPPARPVRSPHSGVKIVIVSDVPDGYRLIQYAYQLFGQRQLPSSAPSSLSGMRSIAARPAGSNHSTSPTSPLKSMPPPVIRVWFGLRIAAPP